MKMGEMQVMELRKRSDSERKAYIEGALASLRMFEDVVDEYSQLTGSRKIDTLKLFERALRADLEVLNGDR